MHTLLEVMLLSALGGIAIGTVGNLLLPVIFSRGFLIFLYAAFMFGSLAILIARGG